MTKCNDNLMQTRWQSNSRNDTVAIPPKRTWHHAQR